MYFDSLTIAGVFTGLVYSGFLLMVRHTELKARLGGKSRMTPRHR